MLCEYVATKRAGRRHGSQPSNTTDVSQALPRPSSWSTSSGTDIVTSPNLIQPSPIQHTSSYPDVLPTFLTCADLTSSSALTTLSTDFDDLFASPITFSLLDTPDPDSLTQSHINFQDVNSLLDASGTASFLVPEDAFSAINDAVSEAPSFSKPHTPPNSRSSITRDPQSFQDFRSETQCCCLIRALGLMKQLFPNASIACTISGSQGHENHTSQLPTIQTVIAENEQTIEAISNMLQCSCSQDGYLLVIMSLIVLKVLGWYAAAARETPVPDNSQSTIKSPVNHRRQHSEQVLKSPTVVGSYCIDGEDQGRMAAQLVLSELHRVQRLVNVLSQRLKGHEMRNGGADTPDSPADGQDPLALGENTFPFSATMLSQLEVDLRKRLRHLSAEIVNMLRRG